jgi:membrane protease YdiL (CAAX protease family)
MAWAELGLIDVYEIVVQPRLVGQGPTLFAGSSKHLDLKLVGRLEFGCWASPPIVARHTAAPARNRLPTVCVVRGVPEPANPRRTTPIRGDRMTDAAKARKGLGIYFTAVVLASAAIQWRIITAGGSLGDNQRWIMLLMWVPALASLIARIALREGAADVSFRLGGRTGVKALVFAWLFPVVVGLVAYGIAWSLGIARFAPPAAPGLPHAGPVVTLGAQLGLALTAGELVSGVFGAGEELGWRGYMLTRLIQAGVPFPLVASGLIWGTWHLPLILSGQYATGPNPLLSAGLFLVSVTCAGVLIGWLRLWSGSIWPAVLAHGSWNVVIQDVFDRSTAGAEPGGPAALWIGESGILVIAILLLSAAIVSAGMARTRVPA